MISRLASILVAVAYICGSIFYGDQGDLSRCLLFLILPLICIWFGEEVGSLTGLVFGRPITATTPGGFIAFGGWMVLIVPLALAVWQRI